MIYENKPKVDELCGEIRSLENTLSGMKGAHNIEFRSISGHHLLSIGLTADSRIDKPSLTVSAKKYFETVVHEIKTEIDRLKRELEKL